MSGVKSHDGGAAAPDPLHGEYGWGGGGAAHRAPG